METFLSAIDPSLADSRRLMGGTEVLRPGKARDKRNKRVKVGRAGHNRGLAAARHRSLGRNSCARRAGEPGITAPFSPSADVVAHSGHFPFSPAPMALVPAGVGIFQPPPPLQVGDLQHGAHFPSPPPSGMCFSLGFEKSFGMPKPIDIRLTAAHHEAAHAVVGVVERQRLLPRLMRRWFTKISKAEDAARLGDDGGRLATLWGELHGTLRLPIHGASIKPDGSSLGRITRGLFCAELDLTGEDPTVYNELVLGDVSVALAGGAAETILNGCATEIGSADDVAFAEGVLYAIGMVNPSWAATLITSRVTKAFTDVAVWCAVETVAQRLLEKDELNGMEISGLAMLALSAIDPIDLLTMFQLPGMESTN
jgi:hypothetical protein